METKEHKCFKGNLAVGALSSGIYWICSSAHDMLMDGSGTFFGHLLPSSSIIIWERFLAVFVIFFSSGIAALYSNRKQKEYNEQCLHDENHLYKDVLRETIPEVLKNDVRRKALKIRKDMDRVIADCNSTVSPQTVKTVSQIKGELHSLVEPVTNLASFSEIVAEQAQVSRQAFDAVEILKSVVTISKKNSDKRDISIDTSTTDDEIVLYADKNKITRMLYTVMDACVRSSKEGSLLNVTCVDADTDVIFSISGMLGNWQKNEFLKTFVEGNAYVRHGTGNGLVRSVIARSTVLSHKGRIWLNRNEKTTSLNFSIPKDSAPKILVIDDDINTVLMLKEVLERDKYIVAGKTSGIDALSYARNTKPDLIIVDLMMPELDGYEFIEKIEKEQNGEHIPIIVISGFHLDRNILMEVSDNKSSLPYIKKPIDIHELRQVVREVLSEERQPQLNELFMD